MPEPFQLEDATIRVFVGELAGHGAEVTEFTALVGAQLDLPAGGSVTLPVEPGFEHGLIVDAGAAAAGGRHDPGRSPRRRADRAGSAADRGRGSSRCARC